MRVLETFLRLGSLFPAGLIAKMKSRVEHPFRIQKRQFGYIQIRYCDPAKKRGQLLSLFALGNFYRVQRKLMA